MTPRQREAVAAFEAHGDISKAAVAMGLSRSGVQTLLRSAGYDAEKRAAGMTGVARHAAVARLDPAIADILSGYNLEPQERTPEQAWAEHVSAFERKIGKQLDRNVQAIKRRGPYVIFHATDEHIDDDASALSVLAHDIQASHDLGAIMCHGGDLLNNWPLAGKLAKQWAEQSCTLPDALLRAQHFIDIFKPDVWVDGNHEEFNPYLVQLFDGWLPKATIRDYWRCDFTVSVPGGRDCRVALSHKFQKGGSWFHGAHGHIREMLQSEERDLYMDGHFHSDAVMQHTLPERGHTALLVASAGYKMIDKWASRISRGGKEPRVLGRAHWIVVDPFSDAATSMAQAFKCPRQAEAYFGGLQNLRSL